jgi:hypothetical protein
VVEEDREPSWAHNPELIEIRRRTLEEFDRELDQRESVPNAPDPVVADLLSGARACANSPMPTTISNVPAPSSTPYGRVAASGSRGEIGGVLGVPKQLAAPPVR